MAGNATNPAARIKLSQGSDTLGEVQSPVQPNSQPTVTQASVGSTNESGAHRSVPIVIIGGGPAGAAAAITLARAGQSVMVIDKAIFPRDKCCGDGLTTGCLRRLQALGVRPESIPSWQWVNTVMIGSPRGITRRYPLPTDGQFAAIATRMDLDAAILGVAKSLGVQVLEGHSLVNAHQLSDCVRLTVDPPTDQLSSLDQPDPGLPANPPTFTIDAQTVIAADGMWSPTRKFLNPGNGPYLGEWHAYRQYFGGVHTPESRDLWVWFEPDLVPGYFWCFPLANGQVNVGFGMERSADFKSKTMKKLWADLLERPHIRAVLGPTAKPIDSPKAWPIPANVTQADLSDGRVLYIGDAARACDVLTGEGIGQALQTGMLAAESILESLGQPLIAAKTYETRVRKVLGPDHRMSITLTRMMRSKLVCDGAIRITGATNWTRHNFARWLFEDYARGIALTPTKWRWGLMSGPGAFGDETNATETPLL